MPQLLDLLQYDFCHRIRHTGWLAEVQFGGTTGLDRAEIARSGANVPQNHYRCRSPGPAFTHIGALGTLANGVQPVVVNHLSNSAVATAAGQLCSKPVWLAGFHAENLFNWPQNSTYKCKCFTVFYGRAI